MTKVPKVFKVVMDVKGSKDQQVATDVMERKDQQDVMAATEKTS